MDLSECGIRGEIPHLEHLDFYPTSILSPTTCRNDAPHNYQQYLVILDGPQHLSKWESFKAIWTHSRYRVCADGAANWLLSFTSQHRHADDMIPDAVVGDFDSIKPTCKSFYAGRGAQLIHSACVNSTDFGKSMAHLRQLRRVPRPSPEPRVPSVVVLGTLAGRVDQGLGIVGELLREARRGWEGDDDDDDDDAGSRPAAGFPTPIWLVSERSISWLLPASRRSVVHGMAKDSSDAGGALGKHVGVLPIFGPSKIWTGGLEWDVSGWDTEMGGQVSTSNRSVSSQVWVETTNIVLFTVELSKSEM